MNATTHSRKRGSQWLPRPVLTFALVSLLLLVSLAWPRATSALRSNGLTAAWNRARAVGAYRFSASVKQTTVPEPTVLNVGRATKTQTVYLEGETNLPDRQLRLTLWSQGGSVLTGSGGVEIKIEGDRAYARRKGQDWQEVNNFTDLFAPQGDFMAYLAAAKDVRVGDPVVQQGLDGASRLTRYIFDIDGRSYAVYLRDQMEKWLTERGDLPPGVELDLPEQYVNMTGEGELWVGADGLPVRQILRLRFPPTADDQEIQAEIVVDFYFDPARASRFAPIHLPRASRLGHDLLLFVVSVALIALLIVYRRSRALYVALALTLILSMVLTPLLRSVQAAAFVRRQAERMREAEARQRESEMQRTLNALLAEPDHNPNVDPLAARDTSRPADPSARSLRYPLLPSFGSTSSVSDNSDNSDNTTDCDPDDPADTDDDGLTDGNECVLGTNPEVADTDNDGISDGDEVLGFDYNGKTWYTDPLSADTNNDGLGDGQEWNTGRAEGDPPPDLDGDGTPDLFDRDNDGDGVPDGLDLSPHYKGDTVFTPDKPFQLILDGLQAGYPTFVEFQLRPTNPDHLWYAFNVLDWPQGDVQGQIQDQDGATFYDLDTTTARSPNDNGDVKLVPMLEIRISGEPDNLPPQEDLEPYGIFVHNLNDDGDKAVYVPLQLVVDSVGDERVAFSAKMRYLPAETWGNAQQVRLAWLVEALVDVCKTYRDNRCVEYEEMNRVQVIHTYYDDWVLTGLDVREDHGVDYAIVYEDPALDDDRNDDSALLLLSYGLEHTFLAGRDCEQVDDKGTADPSDDECIAGDGQRDITVQEIYRRWNHATNDAVSSVERWGLPDHLSVVLHTYETLDEALATMAMTDTRQILDNHFTAARPITPTLLFAREERYRGANLDQWLDADSNVVQWSREDPRRLTMVLSESDAPLETVVGINWAPYRYRNGRWEAYPIEEFWNELHDRYAAAFANEYSDDEDPEAVRGGAVIVGQMHYLILYIGVSNLVQSADELLTQKKIQTSDKPLWASIAKVGKTAVLFIVNKVIMRNFWETSLALKALYHFMRRQRFFTAHELAGTALRALKSAKQWATVSKLRMGAVAIGVVVVLALLVTGAVLLARSYMNRNPAARITAAVLVGTLLFAGTVVLPILQTINLVRTVQAVYGVSALQATGRVLKASSKFIGASKCIAVVGLIITAVIIWGVFIHSIVSNDVPVTSVAFDMLLAQTIAATILAIVMFALSLTIVGTIIVAIISLIDIILVILGVEWTITGFLTELLTKAIFTYELAIDVDADDLITMGALDAALVRPEVGMVGGAEMEFSVPVTTTITHKDPKDWRIRPYLWLYTENQLRSTTFKHALSPNGVSLSAERGDVRDAWTVSAHHKLWGHTMYTGWKVDRLSTTTTLKAGINRQVDLTIDTAYAIPGVECWTLVVPIPWPPFYLPVPICFGKGVDGSGSDTVGPILFDVLPPTLDEFVDVASWADGMVFRDADGDGLLAQTYNGNDPDDTTWDTDGDGLSDAWEMERSSIGADEGGQFFDPRDPDTDDDGLTDKEEALLGTNPNNPDTDGDTISDYAEVKDGWEFTYAEGKTTWVYSDPLAADPDHDGMDDLFERTLHTCPGCDPLENRYHPYVWNTSPIGLYTAIGDPDGVVRPTQTFVYTTTVQNNLKPDLWVRGTTELDPALLTGGPLGMFFDIARGHSQSLYTDLTAPSGAGDQEVQLTTSMEAQLHTPSVWAWDPVHTSEHDTTAIPQSVAVSAANGWPVPYVVATLEGDQIYVYSAAADGIVDNGRLVPGNSGYVPNAAPDIACDDYDTCLVVWTARSGDTHSFHWRMVLPPRFGFGSGGYTTAPAGETTGDCAVAGTGRGFFLAVWVEGNSLKAATIRYGQISMPPLVLDTGAIGGVDVTYASDRYHVVWEREGDIYAAVVNGAQVITYTVAASAVVEDEPAIAYDPLSQRSLIVYRRAPSSASPSLLARIFANGRVGDAVTLAQEGAIGAAMPHAVSADPMNGGWVVAWRPEYSGNSSIHYRAVGMNGELRGQEQVLWAGRYTPSLALSCAEPRPVAQILFDEGSGATSFADSSGFGNDGYCVNDSDYDCPLSGVGGREGSAVQFDGDKDVVFVPVDPSESAYAVSLWFKASCQTCGLFEVSSDYRPGVTTAYSDRTIYLRNGNICARLGNRFGGNNSCGSHKDCETICSSGANYADGLWHQVVHTFGGAAGGQRLYVDGELVASGTQDSSDLTSGDRLRIGYGEYQYGGYFKGVIDNVVLYSRALSDGEVRDAYRSVLVVYPFDEPKGATRFENIAHNGYGASCEGASCPAAGVSGRAYAAAEFDGADDALIVGNRANTVAEYVYDFEGSVPSEWSSTSVSTTPSGGRRFLGRFGNDAVTLSLSNLPTHDRIEVEFDLFVIRTWDGNDTTNGPDYWELRVDGVRRFQTTFNNHTDGTQSYPDEYWSSNPAYTGAVERGTLGYDPDAVYHIKKSFEHTVDTLQLEFSARNLESLSNESWGLDNVRVRLINDNVPLANTSFTIAFWAKRDQTGRSECFISQGGGAPNEDLCIGFWSNDKFVFSFGGSGNELLTPDAYSDTDWHHWAVTYDADTNTRTIYRDGRQVAQDTASADFQGSGTLRIGRAFYDHNFNGRLDELAIWRDVLTAREIEALYNKVKALDDSVTECALPYAAYNEASLRLNRLVVRETTTFLGKAEQDTTDVVTIDATEPESTITSLIDGAVLNITGTLVIGGEARDNTFVTRVEVSVDGSAWQEAEGTETWTYAWDTSGLPEGDHTIRVRAIDAGGNVETSYASVTVNIDRTPPVLAVTSRPPKAGRDAEGNWTVSLSGTVNDAHPGTVEVLLQGQGDAAAGFGWQPATVAGNTWSIDYLLTDFDNQRDRIIDPTGVYTLSLRASDLPGNVTPEGVYLPTVNLDNTPPEVALTFPFSNTAALTDTARYITGIVTDTGAVAYGVADVEIAFVNVEEVTPTVTWHSAVLDTPGAITSTWYYTLPADMEGYYAIYLRGTDVVGNRNDRQPTWQAWQGMIDTRDPYVDALADYGVMGTVTYLSASDIVTYTDITCQARDLTLDIDRFSGCPCDESTWRITTYDQVSPWYRETFSDTTRIYQVDAHCLRLGEFVTPPTVHAYDAAGRHSQTVLSETISIRLLDSAILTPTDGTVFTTTAPFNVEGHAVAIPWGVGVVTVTVNGNVWQTHIYGSGFTANWSDSFDPATYNPPGDGRYRFLSLVREANNPDGNREQTLLHPVTITVDSLPPSTPTFTTTVFTTAHRAETWPVFLTGVVTDIVGVERVELNRDGEGWVRVAHDGTTWRFRWTRDESRSDNVTYTVSVRAVDLVSHTSQATATIVFDVVPPAPVTITMEVQDPLNPLLYYPVQPGQIITDSHVLRLEWTSSSDGAGVRGYLYGWTTSPTATTGLSYTAHTGLPAYSALQTIGEAQTVYAHVVPIDNYGNRQEQVEGPVYVDSPLTPDIIDLDYHGWMDSGCSLVGVDRRVERHAFDGAALSEPQRFYVTWNETALRMAWEGANWDYEGDLFIYFDTIPGGATTLYNPYTATMTNTTIYLPGNVPPVDTSSWPEFARIHHAQLVTPLLGTAMQADTLLWVQSTLTATLLYWNGSEWVSPTLLTSDQYHWDAELTDLYVPFSMLGITQPVTTSLNLLAVASEENALRLWATMPDRNLVDSSLAVNPTAAQAEEHVYMLTRPYHWYSLGSGICPNDPLMALTGETFPDSDLEARISAQPVGTAFTLMGDDLYHQWRAFYLDEGPEDRQFDFLDHSHPPVGHGDTITYTLTVANRGPVTARDVRALVSAYYALSLPGATQDLVGYREYKVIDIGDVAPGATVTATFTGTVNVETNWRYAQCLLTDPPDLCEPLREWAVLEGMLFDERTPLTLTLGLPTEPAWEWLWVDHQVDSDPPEYVGIDSPRAVVGPLTTTVTGYAYDPSGVLTVEVQVRDPLSVTTIITCTDPTPDDGRWSCPWNVSGNDGDEFDLRARAIDRYGHVSEWTSPWRTVVLDSTPPTVTIDAEAWDTVSGQLIGPDGYLLTGLFTDTHSLGTVEVCRDTPEGAICDPATIVLSTQAPTDTERLYDDVPSAPIPIGATCLTRTFTVTENFFVADVNLGFAAAITNREELVVDLFSPSGTSARVIGGLGSDANIYANYDVWLDDAAPGELHNRADDDVAEPYFDRAARPDERLSVFNGEPVSGTWTLRICDLVPLVNQATYYRARLSLTPQSSAVSSAGRWAYALPTPEDHDSVVQTLSIYGLDSVGNRVGTPIVLTYTLDTVAPVISVTTAVRGLPLLDATNSPVLMGHVSEGGELEAVYLRVDPPDGASYRDAAVLGLERPYNVYLPQVYKDAGSAQVQGAVTMAWLHEVDRYWRTTRQAAERSVVRTAAGVNEVWHYTLRPDEGGVYTLWVEAYDRAGNVTVLGPYSVQVAAPVYLPVVMNETP